MFRYFGVFISYSHRDERWRQKLETHLCILERQNVIEGWHDRKIEPGADWERTIDERLNAARVILFLVSPDFIASDYCYGVEVQRAMNRHQAGAARIIPIILEPVDWRGAPFGRLQALPRDAKPVALWANRNEAFLSITSGIRAVVETLSSGL